MSFPSSFPSSSLSYIFTASDSNTTPPSHISQTHPYPAYIHFHPANIFHPIHIHINICTSAFAPHISFSFSFFAFASLFSLLFVCMKEKRTYKMTSKLQRKIRAVSETAACTAVEGALDAVLFVRNEKKNQGG